MILRNLLCFLLLGLSILAQSQPVNDDKANAIEIPHNALWHSADAAYTNVGATVDESIPTLRRPYHNVWFKFMATSEEVDIRALVGGSKGTFSSDMVVTLWDEAGDPVIQVHNFYIQQLSLDIGDWYYFSVDSNNDSPTGTFSLRVSNTVTNDLRAKAEILPHIKDWVSADAAYSNIDATSSSDGEGGLNNVWFKFQATTSVLDFRIVTGGTKGSNTLTNFFLWDDTGMNAIKRANDPYMQLNTLVPGRWYYISVESPDGNTGTFTLRLSNEAGYDMAAFAKIIPHTASWTSGKAAYTNVDATGATFNNEQFGGRYNVWFKFQATSSEVDVRLLTGGDMGTLANPRLILWDNQGNQLNYRYTYFQTISLVVGQWYYVSVDEEGTQPGTFGLQVSNKVGYDMRDKAELLKNISSWQSADAAYTLVNATGDDFSGNLYGGVYNVWFKFVATTTDINIDILSGGSKGTLGANLVKLFDASGVPLTYDASKIKSTSLVPGSLYYFSVDTNGSDPGTYTLKIADHVGYDMKGGAEVIQHASGWCTDNAYYSTVGATPDETNSSTCGGFRNNVWFKFQATGAMITIKLSTGGDKGTLAYPAIYLLDNTGVALACNTNTAYQTAEITFTSLIKGSWYYFVVDSYNASMGTFTLCVDGGSGSEMNSLCKGIFCDGNGAMGINTSVIPAGFKLSVYGKVIAEGVKVQLLAKWPDFVFNSDYDLTELGDLKKYIQQNGHLPNIPSEAEVKKDGIDLATMNALLLQKIEEMTMHLIRVEERVKALETENKSLKK